MLLSAFMTAYGLYVCYLMLRRPEELAVEENHVSWAHMYRMMFVAQIGFAARLPLLIARYVSDSASRADSWRHRAILGEQKANMTEKPARFSTFRRARPRPEPSR